MNRMIFAALGLTLAACQPAGSQPPFPPPPGPASLQLVPPSFYSRTLRPGPARGQVQNVPQERAQPPSRERPPVVGQPIPLDPEPTSELMQELEDAKRTLEDMNRHLQQLRRSITRPANPRAAPVTGPEDNR